MICAGNDLQRSGWQSLGELRGDAPDWTRAPVAGQQPDGKPDVAPRVQPGSGEGRTKIENDLGGDTAHLNTLRLLHRVPAPGLGPIVDKPAQSGFGFARGNLRDIGLAELF